MEWQPISTAPKSPSKRVDLWSVGERWTDCWWDFGQGCWVYWQRMDGQPARHGIVEGEPTHWMEPPEDPDPARR